MGRIILVPGFLEMVLKLLFGIATALSYCSHLLGRGRCMCVLVRSMVRHGLTPIFTHTGILPLDIDDGKPQLLPPNSAAALQTRLFTGVLGVLTLGGPSDVSGLVRGQEVDRNSCRKA
jgi:hypothetical protein